MYEAPTQTTCNSKTMVHFQDTKCPTLLDENVHGIRFSKSTQNGQIHGIKSNFDFEFQLYKLQCT